MAAVYIGYSRKWRDSMARIIVKFLDAVDKFLTIVADWFYE